MVKFYSVVLRKSVVIPHNNIKRKIKIVRGRKIHFLYGLYKKDGKVYPCYKIVNKKDYDKYK